MFLNIKVISLNITSKVKMKKTSTHGITNLTLSYRRKRGSWCMISKFYLNDVLMIINIRWNIIFCSHGVFFLFQSGLNPTLPPRWPYINQKNTVFSQMAQTEYNVHSVGKLFNLSNSYHFFKLIGFDKI